VLLAGIDPGRRHGLGIRQVRAEGPVRLKIERERLGLSQEALGRLGGVGRQSQFRFEADSRSPDVDYLAGIARAGVDLLYVIMGKRKA
jgi:transcriptional regulator with XRE-family HTH domain